MTTHFDKDKFAKVLALMKGGATDGEREAAKSRANAMAARAGLTLEQAIHIATETDEQRRSRELNEEFERQQQRNRAEAVRRYGPEEVIFAETEEEKALSEAVEPFKEWSDEPAYTPYVEGLAGWSRYASIESLPLEVANAIRTAVPFPTTVRSAWEESKRWHTLIRPRCAYDRYYDPELWVSAREDMIAALFFTLGASTLDDIRAREEWLIARVEWSGWWPDDTVRLARRMRLDAEWVVHEVLMRTYDRAAAADPPPNPGLTRTQALRNAVLEALRSTPDRSDREIAAQLACSPQTINTWRKRLRNEGSIP